MLSSFTAGTTSHEDQEDPSDPHHQYHHHHHHHHHHRPYTPTFISAAAHHRQLLINCAELVSQTDFSAAQRLLSVLSSTSSSCGDSTDRLVHQFTLALSIRLDRRRRHHHHHHHHYTNPTDPTYMNFMSSPTTTSTTSTTSTTTNLNRVSSILSNSTDHRHDHHHPSSSSSSMIIPYSINALHHHHRHHHHHGIILNSEIEALQFQSSFISLNQVTPFIRFSHLTANQAILEAVEGHQFIHILDFDTMQGVQWPPLMQALASRTDPSNPPSIRITGTGQDPETLRRTGDRLESFAQSLGLRFQFHPLLLVDDVSSVLSLQVPLLPNETLAVNCVLYLHRLLSEDSRDVRLFLRTVKAMNPKIVTVAEREANHNHPSFLRRFVEAVDHYAALFESLEATLPPSSRERLAVEQVWFGREIVDIVCGEGEERRERHERFESWVEKMSTSGFSNVGLSPFALSQAKLLLRLHYPSEGEPPRSGGRSIN
ncbi:hypothetical protein Scep_013620 [Stephania cephalantha]|uniref:Scarecrow-like protein 18 n=1 Tax=Stephania cephalantha TaxID=152367 RepID=A0AAP0P7K5_9MAGN